MLRRSIVDGFPLDVVDNAVQRVYFFGAGWDCCAGAGAGWAGCGASGIVLLNGDDAGLGVEGLAGALTGAGREPWKPSPPDGKR